MTAVFLPVGNWGMGRFLLLRDDDAGLLGPVFGLAGGKTAVPQPLRRRCSGMYLFLR